MSEQIHIIIAGDQSRPKSFHFSRRNFYITLFSSLAVLCLLATGFLINAGIHVHHSMLVSQMASTEKKINQAIAEKKKLAAELDQVIAEKNDELDNLKINNDLLIAKIELESSKRIADLEKKNLLQEASFKEEREKLLSTAVSELNERSEFIENVISNIGIKVKQNKIAAKQNNSGGPYIAAEDTTYDELLYRTDSYLKTIQALPLGRPTKGSVSSWYGKRQDPLNGKSAFHSGIDIRGRNGDPVIATAEGKVSFAGRNGGFGRCVKIDHGNGYVTTFAHLENYHVKKGDYVSRGQVIGLVGDTGRSTGSHLHYEITYKGRSVNPSKFMKIANLTCSFNKTLER